MPGQVLGGMLLRRVGWLAGVAQRTVVGELAWCSLGSLAVSASRVRMYAVGAPLGLGLSVM